MKTNLIFTDNETTRFLKFLKDKEVTSYSLFPDIIVVRCASGAIIHFGPALFNYEEDLLQYIKVPGRCMFGIVYLLSIHLS